MKAFLFLSALFLASCFEVTIGQKEDHDIRMENFLNNSLAAFPNWLKQNGLVPDPLDGSSSNFALQSADEDYGVRFDIHGKTWNRFYHGYEKNIEALDINSYLSESAFRMDLTYGDEDSYIEGEYSLGGAMWVNFPVHGKGKFYRTNLPRRMKNWAECFLDVTDEGYFQIDGYRTTISPAPFQTFTLDGLDEDTLFMRDNLTPTFEGWHKGQYEFEGPRIARYWVNYMREIFAVTPIADIVGNKFNSKLITFAKKSRKIPKVGSEKFFDKENNEWCQKTYQNNN